MTAQEIAQRLNTEQHYLRHARETSWPSAKRELMRAAALAAALAKRQFNLKG